MTIHEKFYTDRFRAVTGFYRQNEADKQVEFIGRMWENGEGEWG